MREVHVVASSDLTVERRDELTRLCAAAFGEPWDGAWERLGNAIHAIAEIDGRIVAHACIIERELHVAGRALRTAYVEAMATEPRLQRQGHGLAVMERIGELIREVGYELGALSTGSQAFYERAGWERWRGPTFVRLPDGKLQRSEEEDGGVMVLRTATTPADLDLAASISVPWRPVEPW